MLLRFVVVFAVQQTGSAELPARVNKFLLPARLQTKILLFYNFKIFPHFRTLAMEPQFSVVKHWRWNIKTPSPLLLFHGSTSWSEIDLKVTPQTLWVAHIEFVYLILKNILCIRWYIFVHISQCLLQWWQTVVVMLDTFSNFDGSPLNSQPWAFRCNYY